MTQKLFEMEEKKQTSLGMAMAGGSTNKRQELDFYPTPSECTIAMMDMVPDFHGEETAEPACGDGSISKVLESFYGCKVHSSDIADRGYGATGVDFFSVKKAPCRLMITNPPFVHAEGFIRHGFGIGFRAMALLLKLSFFNAASRRKLFFEFPPVAVMPLTWRVDFLGLGRPTMECAWFVWDKDSESDYPIFYPLERPNEATLNQPKFFLDEP